MAGVVRMSGRVLKAAALAMVLLLPLASTGAQARPNTRAMTCDQAARLVARAGGIVLDTSSTTFDRYVSDLRFCMPQQALRPAFEPTRDNPQCFIGYTCYDPGKETGAGAGAGEPPAGSRPRLSLCWNGRGDGGERHKGPRRTRLRELRIMNNWSRAVLAPVLLAGAVVASGAALAQGLPDSRKMSCAQATAWCASRVRGARHLSAGLRPLCGEQGLLPHGPADQPGLGADPRQSAVLRGLHLLRPDAGPALTDARPACHPRRALCSTVIRPLKTEAPPERGWVRTDQRRATGGPAGDPGPAVGHPGMGGAVGHAGKAASAAEIEGVRPRFAHRPAAGGFRKIHDRAALAHRHDVGGGLSLGRGRRSGLHQFLEGRGEAVLPMVAGRVGAWGRGAGASGRAALRGRAATAEPLPGPTGRDGEPCRSRHYA